MSWLVSKPGTANKTTMYLTQKLHLEDMAGQVCQMIGTGNQAMMPHATLEFRSVVLASLQNKKSIQSQN